MPTVSLSMLYMSSVSMLQVSIVFVTHPSIPLAALCTKTVHHTKRNVRNAVADRDATRGMCAGAVTFPTSADCKRFEFVPVIFFRILFRLRQHKKSTSTKRLKKNKSNSKGEKCNCMYRVSSIEYRAQYRVCAFYNFIMPSNIMFFKTENDGQAQKFIYLFSISHII